MSTPLLPIEQLAAVLAEHLNISVDHATPTFLPLGDALGRVAAIEVTAPHPQPSTPVSRVDGYLLGKPDAGADAAFRVVGESVPGGQQANHPKPGEALFVMTGGPLPESASAVVPVEQVRVETDRAGNSQIYLLDGDGVTPLSTGARIAAGATLVAQGARIGPNQIAQLADFGLDRVAVFSQPRVDLLAVGSEFGDPTGDGHHHNSNGAHLAALVTLCGGLPTLHPPAMDTLAAITGAMNRCAAPLIITTGGTAKGRHDLTRQAITAAGYRWIIDGLQLRPGRSTRVAIKDGGHNRQIVVSLPGSPGAIGSLFTVLIQPILRQLCGERGASARHLAALSHDYHRPRPEPLLASARVQINDDGRCFATLTRDANNGYLLLPAGDTPVAAGTVVTVYPDPGSGRWPSLASANTP